MTFRENITEHIKKNRPKLNESSVKTYTSILFNINKQLNPDNDDLKIFNDDDRILNHLKDKTPKTRKTILSALFILTKNEKYNELMLQDCKATNEYYKEQKKSKTEEQNWMTVDEIKNIYDDLFNKVNSIFSKQTISDDDTIINFILLGLLGGGVSGLPPRRSLDYADMKIKNYTTTDNYYKAGKMYFNTYKTAKFYGEQTLDIKKDAPELNKIIMKWIKINPTDYLLYGSTKQKLTSPQITKRLNNILGRNISTSLLRHIYLTKKFGGIDIKEMEETATEMGNSSSQVMLYVKK